MRISDWSSDVCSSDLWPDLPTRDFTREALSHWSGCAGRPAPDVGEDRRRGQDQQYESSRDDHRETELEIADCAEDAAEEEERHQEGQDSELSQVCLDRRKPGSAFAVGELAELDPDVGDHARDMGEIGRAHV